MAVRELDNIDSFKDGRMTVASLERHLRDEYPILEGIEEIATDRGIPIHEAFQGAPVSAFEVLAPTRSRYLNLLRNSLVPQSSPSRISRINALGQIHYLGAYFAPVAEKHDRRLADIVSTYHTGAPATAGTARMHGDRRGVS